MRKNRHNLPAFIYQFALTHNVDAILIGSRGRDSFSSMIMGSVAESLIEHDQYLPLIVVKSKIDYMELTEAIETAAPQYAKSEHGIAGLSPAPEFPFGFSEIAVLAVNCALLP